MRASLLLLPLCACGLFVPGPEGGPPPELDAGPRDDRSCAHLGEVPEGVYTLAPEDSPPFEAYCKEGWTLALKADGAEPTFAFGSTLWSTAETLNEDAVDLDLAEAKYASFSTVPFEALRIELLDADENERVLELEHSAESLLAVFAPGVLVETALGREAWLGLLDDDLADAFCNREGFNVENNGGDYMQVRLGIITNNEDDCGSTDHRVGIGGASDCDNCGGIDMAVPTVGAVNGNRGEQEPAFARLWVRGALTP